MALVTAEVTWL
jgi:hypothetical protein